jgi:hypothetical protein
MTPRQLRAYIAAAEKIRAKECLEEASIASIHAMPAMAAKKLLDAWFFTVWPKAVEKVVDGQAMQTVGGWKILDLDQSRAFIENQRVGRV